MPIYIVHLSAAEALEMVTEARDRGLPAYAETCPQYLFLSYANYEEPGFEGAKYVMSPPLRAAGNEERLWRGLAGNDLQAISTDHCPFCMKGQKELGTDDFSKIPNGAPGIETRMSLVWDGGVRAGRISINRFVELTSTAPAKIFGLFPRKGTIAPGSDADIVIFDPEKKVTLSAKTLHMKVDYNPYEGRQVTGAAETVLSRGRVIVENGKFIGKGRRGVVSEAQSPQVVAKRSKPMSTTKTQAPTSELTRSVREKHKEFLFPATIQYYKEPIVLTEGKGLRIRDADGNEYLDFFGGILTVSVGHANDRVNAAVRAQIDRLSHVSTLYPTLPVVELAERLARLAPGQPQADLLHRVRHGGRRDRGDAGGALHGIDGDRRAAARILRPLHARAVADRASPTWRPLPSMVPGRQARRVALLLPLPAAADVSLLRNRLRQGHRRAHPHDDDGPRRRVHRRADPGRRRASSRLRRSTSRSRSRSSGSSAASSSATRSRRGSAARAARCGASSTGASSRTS